MTPAVTEPPPFTIALDEPTTKLALLATAALDSLDNALFDTDFEDLPEIDQLTAMAVASFLATFPELLGTWGPWWSRFAGNALELVTTRWSS